MKIVGLLLVLALIGVAFYFTYGQTDPEATGPAPSATLGAPPPTDVARNAETAKNYTKTQTCLADCTSEERMCKGTAFDPPAIEACDKTKTECVSHCQ
jgi:hypothetical protein